MEIGLIGMGKMGANMAQRLLASGHRVVVFDRHPEKRAVAVEKGATEATSIEELVDSLPTPKVVWSMVQAGAATDEVLGRVLARLSPGDILIDGGNSHFKETIRHAREVEERGVRFLDAGTSGGIWGLEVGYCLMVGGNRQAFEAIEPILKTLAPPDGYAYMGEAGSGHFVKMVHNGIEYGMMQAYGEGFEILRASPYPLDLHRIAGLWQQGSVVRSWLLELLERALKEDPDLSGIQGVVADSGEGRWTVMSAIEEGVPAPVIALSLMARYASRQEESFSAKVAAALRHQFGGHAVERT